MENTKKLFYRYDNKCSPDDMPEVKAALTNLNTFLEKNLTTQAFGDAEDLSSELYMQSEMQGFVYGFQYAMRIAAECWTNTPDHTSGSVKSI